MDPDNSEKELARRSDAFIDQADFGQNALDVNSRLVELKPSDAMYWSRLGCCYESADRLEDAKRAFERALRIDPNRTVPRTHLKAIGVWLEAKTQVEAIFREGGEAGLRQFVNSIKDSPDIQLRLEGRKKLLEVTEGSAWDLVGLAREVGRTGAHERALGLYRKAYTSDPEVRAAAFVGAAAVLRRMGRLRRAEELCQRVLNADPHDEYALNTLGAILKDQKRDEGVCPEFGCHRGLVVFSPPWWAERSFQTRPG